MPKKLLNENQTCLCMSVPNSDLNLSSGPAKDGDGRDVPFGGKDAEVVEKGCLASDPDQTRLRPNILLVLLGICSHLARAAQHLLSRLLTGSELSSGICSVLSGCPPRPFPQVGKVGKPPSGEEHQDNMASQDLDSSGSIPSFLSVQD